MRKDEPKIIRLPPPRGNIPYDESEKDEGPPPYDTRIPLSPLASFPPYRSRRGKNPRTLLREEGLHHVQTLQEELERFFPSQSGSPPPDPDDHSLEEQLAFFSPSFEVYLTRPDGGELYVSHRELKTPAGIFKGEGWHFPTLPPKPEFSRFKPLSEGAHRGVILFKPVRAYDPTLVAFLSPPSEYSFPSRSCMGPSSAHAFPLTADVSILQEDHVTVLGEAYRACLFLPERDA